MSFLALERVEKRFADGTHAVRGIDLSIERGEFVVLLGPSGCGKTTTLRMLAGLELPTSGRIRIGGSDVTALPPSRRDIGFVFQFYALYPHLSVAENIAFPLRATGTPRDECRRRVREVAARVGIETLLERRPRGLSGGDMQRVSLARAMVREPAAWLMDEPLGTLDAEHRAEMVEFLRARQRESGVTTVYVTHDQEEAMRLADRVVVMSAGAIEQCGPPAEVYAEPATLFVARFVGSPGMNLFEGACSGGAFHAPCASGPLPLPRDLAVVAPAAPTTLITPAAPAASVASVASVAHVPASLTGPCVLGLRPEQLRLDPRGALRGRCVLDAFHGACRYAWIEHAGVRFAVRLAADAPALHGSDVALSFEPSAARYYDPASGRRIA
jgi:multiple sugar transport system ATP-binding protein